MTVNKLFSGRAKRFEFSICLFFEIIIQVVIFYLDFHKNLNDRTVIYMFYNYLILLITFIPIQAITTRRLRDLGINGGWIFLNFIPIINIPFKAYLLFAKSREINSGENNGFV